MLDELFLIDFSLQIKQNVYSIGTYSAPDVTQIIVKMFGKFAKRHIFERMPFLNSLGFFGYKDVCPAVMVVEYMYISKKRGWHKIAKLVNHDRK